MKRYILCLAAAVMALSGCSQKSGTDAATELPSTESASEIASTMPTEQKGVLSGKVILIDAGHGYNSSKEKEAIAPGSNQTKPAFVSGTQGATYSEEEFNLIVAQKLQKKLEALGADIYMTRESHETTLSNIGRAEMGNDISADISVKIHANGCEQSSVHGVMMLVPDNKYIGDEALCAQSTEAAVIVLEKIIARTGAKDLGVIKRSDMTGFNWSKVPVILVEAGYMTNPDEDKLLSEDSYQEKIADGIAEGLTEYFENKKEQ